MPVIIYCNIIFCQIKNAGCLIPGVSLNYIVPNGSEALAYLLD